MKKIKSIFLALFLAFIFAVPSVPAMAVEIESEEYSTDIKIEQEYAPEIAIPQIPEPDETDFVFDVNNIVDIFNDLDVNALASNSECHITQIRELVPILDTRNRVQSHSVYSSNSRFNRLVDLQLLLTEASTIVNTARGRIIGAYDSSNVVIAGVGEPWEGNNTYGVKFLSEEYLELIDLIIEFTGIPEEMLEIEVINELPSMDRFSPVQFDGFTITDFIEDIEPNENEADVFQPFNMFDLRMGSTLYTWHPHQGIIQGEMTLGHPADSSGRDFYTTNHGVIWNGAGVFVFDPWHGFVQVGTVVNTSYNNSTGVDVSRIRLFTPVMK